MRLLEEDDNYESTEQECLENILGKIYLKDGNFHVNITDDDSKFNLKKTTFNGPVNFNRVHIKLYDEYGNIIHLNKMVNRVNHSLQKIL